MLLSMRIYDQLAAVSNFFDKIDRPFIAFDILMLHPTDLALCILYNVTRSFLFKRLPRAKSPVDRNDRWRTIK